MPCDSAAWVVRPMVSTTSTSARSSGVTRLASWPYPWITTSRPASRRCGIAAITSAGTWLDTIASLRGAAGSRRRAWRSHSRVMQLGITVMESAVIPYPAMTSRVSGEFASRWVRLPA